MRVFLISSLAFVAGLVVGWSGSILFYIIAIDINLLHDRDGGSAMGFAFVIGPFVGVVLGIISAITVARMLRRRARERAAAIPDAPSA